MNTDNEQNCPKNKKLPPNLLPNEGIKLYDVTLIQQLNLESKRLSRLAY